jgi:molybdenum cofactor cytidylyltransferase
VTGGAREQVERLVGKTVQTIYNEDYKKSGMLGSIQLGLTAKMREASAALICLGDQPQVEEGSVRSVCDTFLKTSSSLVVQSYQKQRGHPWLVARVLWDEILLMREPDTMRNFLNRHKSEIRYVESNTPTILQDVDTPEDYLKYKPSV